jgi:hypothetical protein
MATADAAAGGPPTMLTISTQFTPVPNPFPRVRDRSFRRHLGEQLILAKRHRLAQGKSPSGGQMPSYSTRPIIVRADAILGGVRGGTDYYRRFPGDSELRHFKRFSGGYAEFHRHNAVPASRSSDRVSGQLTGSMLRGLKVVIEGQDTIRIELSSAADERHAESLHRRTGWFALSQSDLKYLDQTLQAELRRGLETKSKGASP